MVLPVASVLIAAFQWLEKQWSEKQCVKYGRSVLQKDGGFVTILSNPA